jgi:hypothetical protein
MRKVIFGLGLLSVALAGCSPIIVPVAPEIASVSPSVPIAEQPAIRQEVAKLIEIQIGSGRLYSLPIENARIAQISRKRRGVERPAYCVYFVMRDLINWPNRQTWLIENSIVKSGNTYLSIESGTYGCPGEDAAEPFPELMAAREARRAAKAEAKAGAAPKPAP